KWRAGSLREAALRVRPALPAAAVAALAAWLVVPDGTSPKAALGAAAALWGGAGILAYAVRRWRRAPRGRRYAPAVLGTTCAQFGAALVRAGVLAAAATAGG